MCFSPKASTYLSAELLLREDTVDSLQMVNRVIRVFRCFRGSYQTHRERLANHVKHAPWDFPSAMIFARFNQFFNRMLQLEVRQWLLICVGFFFFSNLGFTLTFCGLFFPCFYENCCRTCLKLCWISKEWKNWSLEDFRAKPVVNMLLTCIKTLVTIAGC